MDYAKQIHIIDNTIATLNSEVSNHYSDGQRVKSRGEALKKLAILALNDAGSSSMVKQAIENVSFYSLHCSDLPIPIGNFNDRVSGIESTFQQGVKSLIMILQQERERLVKEQQDEIQRKSLFWAKIAAFGSIASIIVSIIFYLCNN